LIIIELISKNSDKRDLQVTNRKKIKFAEIIFMNLQSRT
jgi:hypothetical protein